MRTPKELVDGAMNDAEFHDFHARFERQKVRTWSTIEERGFLYALASNLPAHSAIVEIGSFCGGSAAFLGAGLRKLGSGHLFCVDPFLGAPPWLGIPSHLATYLEFKTNVESLGVGEYVTPLVGDAASVAASWPALPIQLTFIDGDHSFHGGLLDIECWAPKVVAGGLILFDDIDNIAEMKRLQQLLLNLDSLSSLGVVGGIGVFEVKVGGFELRNELENRLLHEGIVRPWSYKRIHELGNSAKYLQSRSWTSEGLDLAYCLAYRAAADGSYGFTPDCPEHLKLVIEAVAQDRGDGPVIALDQRNSQGGFRVVVSGCGGVDFAPKVLSPGGLMLVLGEPGMGEHEALTVKGKMTKAGLDGVALPSPDFPLFWGVADILSVSAHRLAQRAFESRA